MWARRASISSGRARTPLGFCGLARHTSVVAGVRAAAMTSASIRYPASKLERHRVDRDTAADHRVASRWEHRGDDQHLVAGTAVLDGQQVEPERDALCRDHLIRLHPGQLTDPGAQHRVAGGGPVTKTKVSQHVDADQVEHVPEGQILRGALAQVVRRIVVEQRDDVVAREPTRAWRVRPRQMRRMECSSAPLSQQVALESRANRVNAGRPDC